MILGHNPVLPRRYETRLEQAKRLYVTDKISLEYFEAMVTIMLQEGTEDDKAYDSDPIVHGRKADRCESCLVPMRFGGPTCPACKSKRRAIELGSGPRYPDRAWIIEDSHSQAVKGLIDQVGIGTSGGFSA